MAQMLAGDIRKGVTFEFKSGVYTVTDFQHVKPGKGPAFVRTKLKNLENGRILDKNYSETRVPGVPSAILETMSHQNFPDMRYGQDPNFKFTLARSIYKTILRYISEQHGRPYAVTPLTPQAT